MPNFKTPEPITATLELVASDVRITAGDGAETIVDIAPSDSFSDADVRAAEQVRVDYSAGRLLVKAPKQRRISLFSKPGSVDVTIELPAGSRLDGESGIAAFRCVGRLGDCRIKIGAGEIQLDETARVDVSTGAGAITIVKATGDADVSTGTGKIRVGAVSGNAIIKNSNGDIWIGDVGGDLRAKTANGDISIDSAGADATAATAMGDVRLGDVARGSASLRTAMGQIEVGIHSGTAARLDVHTSFGRVHNHMDAADDPAPSDERVDVRAHTGYGDIAIRRA